MLKAEATKEAMALAVRNGMLRQATLIHVWPLVGGTFRN